MAFDCNNNQRKPLLFSDLFKSHGNTENSSCSSSSTTQFLSSYDSSSSGFSTPLYSDLGSSESEDGDFIAELTRQMAECMLQDEDTDADSVFEAANSVNHSAADENDAGLKNWFCSNPVCFEDQMPPKIQMKNQSPGSKKGPLCRGKRVKGTTESAQQKQSKKTELQYKQYRGMINGYSGSGMQAVFLGGSGPRIGPPGTGVFLPRSPSEIKSKSGCSTVLIPTRVLQVLEELQRSKNQDSRDPQLGTTSSPKDEDEEMRSRNVGWAEGGGGVVGPAEEVEEMQLPQEWTY